MQPVAEIQRVNDRLFFWQDYEPAVKTDLSSHAVLAEAGFVLVDPIPLTNEAFAELTERAPIAAIFLTSANHERAAADFSKKTNAPIIANEEARPEITIGVDTWIRDGDLVAGLRTVYLPGFAGGESVLFSTDSGGTMMMGDALINLDSTGFSILPAKYCGNPKQGRESLRKLLQFDFEVMTFAHGLPIIKGAKQKLEQLLQ